MKLLYVILCFLFATLSVSAGPIPKSESIDAIDIKMTDSVLPKVTAGINHILKKRELFWVNGFKQCQDGEMMDDNENVCISCKKFMDLEDEYCNNVEFNARCQAFAKCT